MGEPFRIRLLTAEDLPVLAGLEKAIFTDPWPGEAFGSALGPYAMGAELNGRLIGFILGRAAADQGEVLNLAVVPHQRRRGVAQRLLDELLHLLAENGVRIAFLEVRESNIGARRFYEKAGFEVVARRPWYYRKPREDALVMRRCISDVIEGAKE